MAGRKLGETFQIVKIDKIKPHKEFNLFDYFVTFDDTGRIEVRTL